MPLPIEGGCQCGAVRYAITGHPRKIYVCHCLECRGQSASAFGISVLVDQRDFQIKSGELRRWGRPIDGKGQLYGFFCPACGSRIYHQSSNEPSILSVKGGSLDQPPDLTNVPHIWTSRALSGIPLPPIDRCYTYNFTD